MPEIWVTDEELATLFACTEQDARKLAHKERLERKTGKDGKSRLRLCPVGVAIFAEQLRAPNLALDLAIEREHARIAQMKALFTKRKPYYPWLS